MKNPVKAKTDHDGTLIVGCGYLGTQVATISRQMGNRVWASTRNSRKAHQLSAAGFDPIVLDWTDRRTLSGLPQVDRVLVAVSYDRRSRLDRYESQVGGLRNLLSILPTSAHVTYISTTGVYHQTDGGWVDERSPAKPTRQGGRAHLDAEQLLNRMRPNSATTILRLSGIYGPGRVPRAADVIAGRPIQSPENGYLNLIHVRDAADAVLATWQPSTSLRSLYLVSDDQPVVRGNFYREIATQCGASEPRFEPPAADAPVSMRSNSNKRIRNRQMKCDLLPKLAYPTYREGLADVLKGINA